MSVDRPIGAGRTGCQTGSLAVASAKLADIQATSRAHEHTEGIAEILTESDNAVWVTRHDEDLFASHITCLEQTNNFVRHFRRAVCNGLRTRRNAIKERRPQN